jgi:hypothetical protein
MNSARWDNDQVGHGVADGSSAAPAIEELLELSHRPEWVAEDPAGHLGESIHISLDALGIGWIGDAVSPAGVYEVDLSYDPILNRKALHAAAWTIIGTIAEASTHVREEAAHGSTVFHVVTGMPEDSTPFTTHGHVVLLRFTPTVRSAPAVP